MQEIAEGQPRAQFQTFELTTGALHAGGDADFPTHDAVLIRKRHVHAAALDKALYINVEKTGTQSTRGDRKSTRLNSSHVAISYAVFCLIKKNVIISITVFVFIYI